MKLNKYLFSTFIAASALLISSCSDFLDRSPQGQFTEDDNPNALVNGKIYNVYTMMRNFNITAGTPALAIHCLRSEDSEKGSIPSDGSDVRNCRTNGSRRHHQQRRGFFLPCLLLLQSGKSLWRSTSGDLQNQRRFGSQHSENDC